MNRVSSDRPGLRPLRTVTRPVPLAQVAYERIRRGLAVGGELDGVERLIEQDLAGRLTMSRTPVREALHRLALMGFLEPSSGGGYTRRSFSIRDAREHYELRLLLEPAAAALAAARPTSARRSAAAELVASVPSPGAVADATFHVRLAERSGNVALARVIATVVERLAGFGIPELGGDASAVALAHRRIAAAIESAEPSAGDEMAVHLEACQRALISQLSAASSRVPTAAESRVVAPADVGDGRLP